jgi:hypothetical protein
MALGRHVDPKYKENIIILFRYFITEDWFRDQFETADLVADELLAYAEEGFAKVERVTKGNLDYALTFARNMFPSTERELELLVEEAFDEQRDVDDLAALKRAAFEVGKILFLEGK